MAETSNSRNKTIRRKRQIYQAEVVTQDSSSASIGAEAVEALSIVTSAADKYSRPFNDDADYNYHSSESDRDDEIMCKPVFVPRNARRDQDEADGDLDIVKTEERREESVTALAWHLHNDKINSRSGINVSDDDVLVDDTDEVDEESEYNLWKLRELARIKRDREERDSAMKAQMDLLLRREMDDEERREHDLEAGIDRFGKQKSKMQYMQKYYHKGAFYQDQDILKRDYTAPTEFENKKVEALPQVLQVRNFGKPSRSKWTHLVNEDTSLKNDHIARQFDNTKRSRDNDELDRPSKKKT